MCSQPSRSTARRRRLRIVVITLHHHVSARADLALLADWHRSSFSSGDTIFISVHGSALPIVETRSLRPDHPPADMVTTGVLSV